MPESTPKTQSETGTWVRQAAKAIEVEMVKLMHQDEQELLSVWEGWNWDDNKGGWLDPELCAKARREEVEYIRRHKMYVRVFIELCSRETGEAPSRRSGWRPTGNEMVYAGFGCRMLDHTTEDLARACLRLVRLERASRPPFWVACHRHRNRACS